MSSIHYIHHNTILCISQLLQHNILTKSSNMGSISPSKHHFIIVGAGPAGSILATRLANSKQKPDVLLVEAGGENDASTGRIDAERWIHLMNPERNWGYKTAPQKNLDDRVIGYDRGKGLGGSTAINFCCWTIGSKDEYDEISQMVGDNDWDWAHAQERFKRIEALSDHAQTMMEYSKYIKPGEHSVNGPIKVGFASVWEKCLTDLLDLWEKSGSKLNMDQNSGDPIGLAVGYSSAARGKRSTAADALINAPSNLKILTHSQVAKVLTEGNKAVGVELLNGDKYLANEIILSAGALDTPRILMHSGVGPADQLNKFGIPIVKANPHVGQHLKDHQHLSPSWTRAEHTSERPKYYRSKELQSAAREQWEKTQDGPLAQFGCSLGMAFEKLDTVYESPEFKDLPAETQKHLLQPTVPSYEYLFNGPSFEHFLDPQNAVASFGMSIILLNLQSTGSTTLQSADASVPLVFDPNYFSHPYDRRLAIEAYRDATKVLSIEDFARDTIAPVKAPSSNSEEDILDFWRKHSVSTWHMTGTARMGNAEKDAVVDKNLRVFGVDGLRVADMSVVPLLPRSVQCLSF